ncbi:PA0069 family radical SAM protein [Pokkaliibacter sp. MBI-7]|uniref:PA0069 family radical SAM protein n=1 Tax=Pokkaliibacter sp. MBI-7 TaxID=3040600 RepID=UPI002446D012|nr:PA0069 family radical SAM protein [Pokkaliibacter sp. MBI-7]MDH2435847.1 PA0069 family radical SAM protein [Pokkaliibacter sp. MBI-7]
MSEPKVFFRQPASHLHSDKQAMRHRGALNNPHNRFHGQSLEQVDDGWYHDAAEDQPSIATEVRQETSKSILSRNTSPDIPFDVSLNPYRGCEHGCIYCFARPSHAYWDMSPGLDFETRLIYKHNAARLLEVTLQKPGYQCQVIALGANTDAYQPIESQYRLTRSLLEVCRRFKQPFSVVTKGALILRDLDILQEMASEQLCAVYISLTSLDDTLRSTLEPRAATVTARLRVIERLAKAGVPVGVMMAPIIPALNDVEIERLLQTAAGAGATSANYVLLRLPLEVSPLFQDWLQQHYPQRADHIMSLVRQTRDGKDYDPSFGTRMRGTGQFADLIAQRFRLACKRYGLNQRRLPLDCSRFQAPGQMSLW